MNKVIAAIERWNEATSAHAALTETTAGETGEDVERAMKDAREELTEATGRLSGLLRSRVCPMVKHGEKAYVSLAPGEVGVVPASVTQRRKRSKRRRRI